MTQAAEPDRAPLVSADFLDRCLGFRATLVDRVAHYSNGARRGLFLNDGAFFVGASDDVVLISRDRWDDERNH
jgi:hypothetical protein